METRIGPLEVSYGARGGATYRVELWHDGLKKHRVIKSAEPEIIHRKVGLQAAEWDDKWSQVTAREQGRLSKEGHRSQQEANKRAAVERTSEAQNELARLTSVLRHTLEINDAV